jgi:hypothetical protein
VTGTTAHSPEPDGDWPAARHRDLLDGLSQHLDPDAGLRDIMLHADHAAFTGALGRHLDTQAGLAAILPPPPAAASRITPGQPGTVAAIAAADPAARMALRRTRVTLAVILSDLTVRALTIANNAGARDLAVDLDLARNLAFTFDRDFARVLEHASTFVITLDLARDRDFAHLLDLARDLARYVDRLLVLPLGLARDRVLALERDLDKTRTNARALALALDLAIDDLNDTRDRALGDWNRPLGLARDLARDVAHRTARMVGDALGLRLVEGLAAALLDGALDDFTHADLAHTDLASSDLTGIRWSDRGTTWPPGTDTDELRTRSQEIAPGIYEITRPGHDDKARHHTPA